MSDLSLPAEFRVMARNGVLLAVRSDWTDLTDLLLLGARDAIAAGKADRLEGRGACAMLKPRGDSGPRVVLKRYRRGGVLGGLLGEYMVGKSRPLDELRLTEALRARGLPVPEILAFKLERVIPGVYRGEIALREIPEGRTLYHVLSGAHGSPPPAADRAALLREVARALRRLHDAGCYHADLHARNVFVSGYGPGRTVHWIDLEKSTVGAPLPTDRRIRNFARLNRSVEKLSRLRVLVPCRARLRFLREYFGPDRPSRETLRRIVQVCRRNVAVHRLWWTLTGEARTAKVERIGAPPRRILVKGVNWLGDAVMSLPALDALRARYPDAHITVLTLANLADVYAGRPSVDEVLPYHKGRGWRGILAWLERVSALRERRFDLAVVLPNSFHSALTIWAADIPRRVGYAKELRNGLLTDRPPLRPKSRNVHRVMDYLQLVAFDGTPAEPAAPVIRPAAEDLAWAEEALRSAGLDPAQRTVIAFNPGATYGNAKRWPIERYLELGRRLVADLGAGIVVVGGPAEQALGDALAAQLPAGSAVSLSGRTSIRRLSALLQRCRLLVTNDTGPMHVAQAVGTRIVAIFGPTDPVNTPPYGSNHVLLRKPVECSPCFLRECPIDHRCMTRIETAEVFRAVEEASAAAIGGNLAVRRDP